MFGMLTAVAVGAGIAAEVVPEVEVVVHPQASTIRTNRRTVNAVFIWDRF
jgi:hypothetical protein